MVHVDITGRQLCQQEHLPERAFDFLQGFYHINNFVEITEAATRQHGPGKRYLWVCVDNHAYVCYNTTHSEEEDQYPLCSPQRESPVWWKGEGGGRRIPLGADARTEEYPFQ